MAGALIEVVGLWKSFNGEPALRGVNLTVRPGEIHGLLGLNGAGKTTTLKCLVGLLKPDRGVLRVCGIDVVADSSYKDLIGYLPENPPLPEYLTAKEFLLFAARLRRLAGPGLSQRVDEMAELFGLKRHYGKLIYELSKGVRQRLAFAAAVVHQPSILILDEPFNGLDPEAQRTAKQVMREIASSEGGVLVSTHLLDSIERICESATIIHEGRTIISGTLDQLRSATNLGYSEPLEEVFIRIISSRRWVS
jgi:ABC-2 type transport system ATP-binding protein